MNDEPQYIMAEPPEIAPPKPRINWRVVFLQALEVAGAASIALGAGLYEPYLGPIVFGVYVVYAANS